MFEITVIEVLPHTTQMFHIALDDEVVDDQVREIIENEEMACRTNGILGYSILSHYERYNKVEHYVRPATMVQWAS